MARYIIIICLLLAACSQTRHVSLPKRSTAAITGSEFYKTIIPLTREERERIAVKEILSGNIPAFLKKFVPVQTTMTDWLGKTHTATFFVLPDYISVGSDNDFARIPLTPMAAQIIADSLHCFLPTRKLVNAIYEQATVKLEPMPLYSYRDSALIFWHHHLIIEGQRNRQKGLIAGIKKDVVLSDKITRSDKPDRVAIYGWHKKDGNPIQPLYTGHVNWYVDYSHGIRLVYRKIKIDDRWMDYTDLLQHLILKALLCDEEFCDCYRYNTN